jgi:hypothetical protein
MFYNAVYCLTAQTIFYTEKLKALHCSFLPASTAVSLNRYTEISTMHLTACQHKRLFKQKY